MRKVLLPVVLLLAFFIGAVNQAHATHIMGVDLTYECIAPGQYKVHLQVFRDCNGILPSNSYSVPFSSVQCGVSSSVTVTQVGPPVDITPVCSQNTTTACNGAGSYGVQKYTYEGIMNLPVGCGNDWVLSWSSCCRNGAITDLTNPLNENIYIADCLDNTQTPCVSSPVFLNNPIPFFCVGVPVNYNHGVVDVAGDSIVFTNVCCLNGPGTPVSYLSPFNCNQPFATLAGAPLVVNPVNGNITFTPNVQQIGVMAVTVNAYRNGVLVSCVTRDMQFTIIPCTGYPPTATGFGGSSAPASYNFTIPACADTCLKIYSADSGGAAVTMTWDHGIPGGTLTTTNATDPIGTFCWAPGATDTGLHSFTVTVANNNCPITGSNTYSYSIRVVPANDPPVIAGPDTTLCPGQPVTLHANVPGGNPTGYAWSDGTNSFFTQNITVNPINTTQYNVTAFFPDGCQKSATVLVTRVQNANISIFPGNISLCSGGAVNLIVSTTATNPTYYWSPTAGLSCTNCPNPVASPASSTQYCVSITDQFGCPSNTVCSQINFSSPPPPQACSVIYATTNGNGNGTKASPTNLAGAIALAQCNNGLIKLATGTYTIDNPITNITSYTTIEGGFDPITWVKTSTPGATTISRSLLNPEGPPNAQRIVAIYLNSQSFFRFQDLTVQTANCPVSATGNGWSNYVFHLTNCNNYNFIRCQIIPGSGGGGLAGTTGLPGAAGSVGNPGGNGDQDNDPVNATGGLGGNGAGALPGSGGAGGNSGVNNDAGVAGTPSGDLRSGGGGGGGGAGGHAADNTGGTGGNGGGINGGGGTAGAPGGNVSGGTFSGTGSPGGNGVTAAGIAGTIGTAAGAPSFTGGFYTPGVQGGTGTDGGGGLGGSGGGGGGGQNCTFCPFGTGDGAGGGGGGGQGGTGGTGGWSGGSSIGVYLFNNGAGGNFSNDDIFLGAFGAFGAGGAGGAGGVGGTGGLGSIYQVNQNEIGAGGNGGNGGAGGNGGPGGNGLDGSAVLYYLDGGVIPALDISFNLAAEPVINVSDVNCTFRDVNFTSAASGNWNFDTVSNPQTLTGANVITQYSSSGRKNITYAANVYQGFFNVPINANSYIPNITTTAHLHNLDTFILCLGSSANFTATIPAADIFDWDFGGAVVPNTYTGANFQNLSNLVFNTAGVFKIKVRISTACCGWSPYDSIYMIVEQTPVLTLAGLRAFCPGDSTTLIASGALHYHWTPATGLNTTFGPTVIAKPPNSPTTYLVKGYSLYGYCIADTQITITVNHPPALTFTTNPATCGGNGSITVVPNPASAYTYSWNDPAHQTTATATALGPGAYIVTVTDPASNCTVSSGVGLSAGTGVQAYIDSSQDASCHGYCDGTARVRGIGGAGTLTYHWSNAATTRLITGLCTATYSVTLTDANSCTATASVIIGEPAPLAINFLDTVNATCPNKNNGSAFSNASGGTGPFQYLWNDPNMQDSSHAVHLFPGIYTVIVVDQHGCVDSAHVPILSSAPVIADTINVIDVSCFGLSDGAISLTVSGGLYPYTYSWQQLPAVTDSFPQNIAAGSYTAYITDANGCADTVKNIPVNQPVLLAATAVTDSVKCFGGSTGGVQINTTGGTLPYQYSMDAVNFQASSSFTGLTANTYTGTIKDGHGCTATVPFTVYQPNLLTATLAGTVDEKCHGDNTGTATITIAGGTLNYSAVLGAQTLTASPYTFTALTAATYNINVTDANGCTATTTATINEPQALVLTLVSTTPATCFGQANGALTVSAAGGTPAYVYSLNGGAPQVSPTFNGILGGLEIVAVVDANQCIDTLHINVPQPAQTTFLDTNVVDVVCFGQSNGSINLIVTGTGGPWTYTWSTTANTQSIANLPIGIYSVTVVDAGNCTAVGLGSINITQPPLLTATDVVKNDSCFGSANGCITVTPAGGTPAYAYTWSVPGAGAQLCNLVMGSYNVTVTDAHSCTAILTNISITQPSLLTLTDTFSNVSCPGKSDGSVTALANGGTLAYAYTWSNGAGNVNPDAGLPKGTYDVTVTDANNCTATVAQVIIELPGIILGAIANNITCPPLHNGLVELTVQTNNPPASYTWSNGAHTQDVFGLSNGTYSVTITDANNCVKDSSFVITTDTMLILYVSPHDTTIDLGHNVAITVATNGVGGNIASILWMPPGGLNCSDCVAPIAFPIQTMSYVATVVSDSGCVASDTSNIIVIPIYEIYIPNVFTPNGDGNNDFFEVFGNKELWKEFEVQVFDRIGEKVFQSNDMNFKWNGVYKGKDMMPAVFVYQIHLTYIDNHTDKLYKGSVTLVR